MTYETSNANSVYMPRRDISHADILSEVFADMKHYIELITVGAGMPRLTTLDNVLPHDLDVLMYLHPDRRIGWIEVHKSFVIINDEANLTDSETEEYCSKPHGVYIRGVNTHE